MEHNEIEEAYLHQPKGASTAVAEQFLKAVGDGTTTWVLLQLSNINDVTQMTNVTTISDPATATTEEVATKVNELIGVLVSSGFMASP